MASGKPRRTRQLRNWVVKQVESGKFPGLCWDDKDKTMFRIPWKHAGKQDFREDQDAAFFKAWAQFKGKHKEGNIGSPAVWKTRLRCALNKSPEFEEVPEKGRMDVAEPYKVYRVLSGNLPAQKSSSKRCHSTVSVKDEDEGAVENHTLASIYLQDPLEKEEVKTNGIASHSDSGDSSGSSPEQLTGTDVINPIFPDDQLSMEDWLPPGLDYSLLLTFIYSGRVVREARVESLDCRLVAEPCGSESTMTQVLFPKPDPLEPTQHLLNQLDRGILVASNSRGLFVQRLCPIPVSWNAPQAPPGPGPHLLPSNECVELFRPSSFCKDLDLYFQGRVPQPKFMATLHFWEETPDSSHTQPNLITVQMEQAFARHLLETPEEQTATWSLMKTLEQAPSALPSLPHVR